MLDTKQIEDARMCSGCKTTKPAVAFGTKGNGTRTKTCLNADPDANAEEEDAGRGLGIPSLHDFLDALTQEDDNLKLEACIDISSISGSHRQRADALTASIWSKMKYCFVYQSKYDHKRTESSRYIYHCAQNVKHQHAPKKTQREGAKPRDKIAMDAFPCNGWLHITIIDWDDTAFVNIGHAEDHVPYWKIDVPSDIIDFVYQNSKLTPTQLWDEILKIHPRPSFTRKVIYSIWADINTSEWKHDPDELKSANILLDEFSRSKPDPKTGKKPLYSVEPIQLTGEPGFTAIAFALPQLLREVGGRVRELSLDSAWDTNGSGYEVYALLGEVYGSGMLLGYLLLQSSPNGAAGGRERFIRQLLRHPTGLEEDMEETQRVLFPSFEAQDSDDEEEVEEYAQKLLQ
ncbi:hypothetical protein DFH09DRAFT_1330397 [Mycena vulgaris]|nr:hypothetical protein DFH09DRAFT_1330397 [Mycena vulgaris]